MTGQLSTAAPALGGATVAVAHGGVQNPAVQKRVDAMKATGPEAKDASREDVADVKAQAGALERLASGLGARIETPEELRAGAGRPAAGCQSRHEEYRE